MILHTSSDIIILVLFFFFIGKVTEILPHAIILSLLHYVHFLITKKEIKQKQLNRSFLMSISDGFGFTSLLVGHLCSATICFNLIHLLIPWCSHHDHFAPDNHSLPSTYLSSPLRKNRSNLKGCIKWMEALLSCYGSTEFCVTNCEDVQGALQLYVMLMGKTWVSVNMTIWKTYWSTISLIRLRFGWQRQEFNTLRPLKGVYIVLI